MSEVSNSQSTVQMPLLNEAITIGFITLWGYLATYNFEVGYLDYFGVSSDFVQINTSNLLNVSGKIFGFLVSLYAIVNGLSAIGIFAPEYRQQPVKRQIIKYGLILLALLIPVFITPTHWKFSLALIALYALWEVFWFTCVYNKGSFRERIELEDKHEEPVRGRMISNRIGGTKIGLLVLLFLVAIWSINMMQSVGRRAGSNQRVFTLVHADEPLIIVRVYSDLIIAKPLNLETNKVANKIRILTYDAISSQGLKLEKKEITNLTFEEEPQQK